MKKNKICFLVNNNLKNDPRVSKQVKTALKAGFLVTVIGWDTALQTPKEETMPGYKLILGCLETKDLLNYPLMVVRARFAHYLRLVKRFILSKSKLKAEKSTQVMSQVKTEQKDLPELFPAKSVEEKPNSWLEKIYKTISIFAFFYAWFRKINRFMAQAGIKAKPDIVHANDLDTLIAGYLIKKQTGARLIYDAHEVWTEQGMEMPSIIIRYFKLIEKKLLKSIDCFITVNESIIAEISRMYRHQFKVPALAVYNCPYYQKTKFKPARGKVKIIYQGRYSPGRGLENLVVAAQKMSSKGQLEFRALGDPRVKQKLEKMVKERKLTNKVKFLEPVAMEDLVKAAASSDIGIISYLPGSINNKLCTPNKLFEYPMSGLALAVSDLPELRKFVIRFKNGVLFNPENPKNIARALDSLILSKSKLAEAKKQSLEAAKIMNWENEEKKLIKVYRDLAIGPKNRA